jgi:hypothetical protein
MAAIDWPTKPEAQPNGCEPALLDFGQILRPSGGGKVQKIDRPGSRFRLKLTLPPMSTADAAVICAALLQAKRQGLRMEVPLLGRSQGNPGLPVVDGANPAGTSLPLRGMYDGYSLRPGYWLTLIDAAGDYYLHMVTAVATVASGIVTATIEPPIRQPFADGATVLISRPKVQGWLTDELSWALNPGEIVNGVSFTIEEAG